MTGTSPLRPGSGRALRGLGVAPQDIERLSMERIRARLTVELPPPPAAAVALRMAYAAADPDLVADLVIDAAAVGAAVAALRRGQGWVVCDTRMVLAGMRAAIEARGLSPLCVLDEHYVPLVRHPWHNDDTRAAAQGSTGTARATAFLVAALAPAIVVIGNAPTALLAVLDVLGDGMPPPAALIATCPGLVAAAEAKQLLLDSRAALGVAVIAVAGTRGGSAVAAAAVNALCRLATDAH